MSLDSSFVSSVQHDGHFFNLQIYRKFIDRRWAQIQLGPRYVDDITGEIREIDLICEWRRNFTVQGQERSFVYRVIIEAKYNNNAWVFITDKNHSGKGRGFSERIICSELSSYGQKMISNYRDFIKNYQHRYFENENVAIASVKHVQEDDDEEGSGKRSNRRDGRNSFNLATSGVIKSYRFLADKHFRTSTSSDISVTNLVVVLKKPFFTISGNTDTTSPEKIIEARTESTSAIAKVNYLHSFSVPVLPYETSYTYPVEDNRFVEKQYWAGKAYFVDIISEVALDDFLNNVEKEADYFYHFFKNSFQKG